MKIGEVARRAGVRVDTVRYYERRGLVATAVRRASGYREFSDAAVTRIAAVKQLQRLGLSLEAVAALVRDADGDRASCSRGRPLLEEAAARIDAEIAELRAKRRRLARMLAACDAGACALEAQRARRGAGP